MPPESKYDLFVSYAAPDSSWVEGYLLDALTLAGVRIIHENAFELGAPRLHEFERAVKESRRVLLVISQAYMSDDAKGFVDLLSQQYGMDTGTWPVIPLIREPVKLPARLSILVSLQATTTKEADGAIARLLADIDHTLAPLTPPVCPYPGMRPFRSDEARFFFGRSSEIEELRLRLRAEPLMLVVGPSGSGKSSLVMAGLIPKLEHEGWTTVNLRPGSDPQTRLRDALLGVFDLESGRRIDGSVAPLLIVVDQLEEIFTQTVAVAKRESFIAELLQLTERANVKTIHTMRADFFGDLMEAETLWSMVEHRRREIKALNAEDLRKAIIEPAAQVTVYVEPALVERLVADAAGEPGMLPFVQETLRLLWERLERRYLPLRAYEALVLTYKSYVSTAENGLLVAMGVHADATFNALKTDRQKRLAQRTFLRLIQFGEGRESTRRQQREQELYAVGDDQDEFAPVLAHLVDHRLLTTSDEEETGERRVDLAHEALIRGWPSLRKWIGGRREQEQIRRRLETKAAEWIHLGRQQGGRLDETELPEATRWLASGDAIELGVSENLLSLVSYSKSAQLAEEKEREAIRQRELTQQQALNRRLYMVLGLISVVLVGMVISVWLVNRERVRANDNARTARVRELVAQAQTLQQEENLLPLSMLLGVEAYGAQATDGGEEVLRQGLAVLAQPSFVVPHTGLVEKVAFSIDEKWMASAGDDGIVRVIEVATGTTVDELEHDSPVHTLMFRPDGLQLATGTDDGTIKLWTVPALEQEGILEHSGGVFSLTYAPNSEWLASAGFEGEAYIWNPKNQVELFVIHHNAVVNYVAASDDSRLIATASDDGTAQIWNVISKTQVLRLEQPGWIFQTIFSFDGKQVATAGSDLAVRIWDATTGEELQLLPHNDWLEAIAFNPDGTLLATASDDDMARIWDTANGQERVRLVHEDDVAHVTFDVTGHLLATASKDGTARVWDVASGREIARMNHDGEVSHVAFNGGQLQVATAGQDRVARLWQFSNNVAQVIRQQSLIWDAAFSPDGKQVATASDHQFTAWLWDIATGAERTHLPNYGAWVRALAFNPKNGRDLAVGVDDTTTHIWDLTNNSQVFETSEPDAVTALAYATDGSELAIGSLNGDVSVWSLPARTLKRTFVATDMINDLTYTADGSGLLSVDEAGFVRLWQLADNSEQFALSHDGLPLFAVALSPEGERLATAGANRTARIWDIKTQAELTSLAHQDEVRSVAWSTDGRWLVTGSADRMARIWDVGTSQELVRLPHRYAVEVVEFDQTGRWLLTTSNNVATIWDVSKLQPVYANELVDAVCRRLPHNLSSSEWERYFPGEDYRQTCPKLRAGPGINDLPDQ